LSCLSSTGSGLVALGSGASMANLISTPRRLIRSGNSRVKTQLAVGSGGCGRTELDPVDYRLEQISSSCIGQQALPLALCFSL
jgi:hypothetical protein